jgi:outer membrane protein OmpA-like peptidoglycan-associated protein
MPRKTWIAVIACALGPLAFAAPAAAQSETPPLALNRFNPAPAGDSMFSLPSPFVAGDPALHVALIGDYAHNPLILRRESDGAVVGNTVEHQLFLHINATLALWHRLGIDVSVPVAVFQDGQSAAGVSAPSTAAFGDVRLGARVRLLGGYHDPFQLGFGGYLWLPTGDEASYVSDGTVRGMPYLAAGGRIPRFLWSTSVGVDIRGARDFQGTDQGTMLQIGAGLGFLLGAREQLQLGPEATVALTFADIQERTTNAELLGAARYRIGAFQIGAAAGPGLSSGIGTPEVRALLLVAYSPEVRRDRDGDGIPDGEDACPDEPGIASDDPQKHGCPVRDRDGDGIPDGEDACPDEPGIASDDPGKHGCPVRDRDGDGIADDDDACPDEPGIASEDPAKHGCPVRDRDGDGIADDEDACPDEPGVASDDPKKHGCPPDRDGDGIPDGEDACPDEPGVRSDDPEKHGCPLAVRVTETEIVILQQVQFDTGKATIRPESDELLDEIAMVLSAHKVIAKVEVQGHTDNRGGRRMNMKLSTDRAASVVRALVERGIAAERLTSVGHGPDKPIADNKTAEGRQQNRRVQFVILERTK